MATELKPAAGPTGLAVGTAAEDANAIGRWQLKLLPFMTGFLIVLTAVFISTTLLYVWRIQQRIEDVGSDRALIAEDIRSGGETGITFDEIRWRSAVRLEEYAMHRRYQQASLILMSRVWIIYLGFVTGMILALVGAAFVLGKLREPTSKLAAETGLVKFSLGTASPGLVLAVLGTVLMTATMVIRADVSVNDSPLYVGPDVRLTTAPGGSSMPTPATTPTGVDDATPNAQDDSDLDDVDEEARRRATNQ